MLTVSGTIPEDVHAAVQAGRRPRVDYIEMADAFGADLLDNASVARSQGRIGRLVLRLFGANAALALRCFTLRKRYDLIFTDGEQVGLPLAMLMSLIRDRGRPRHLMIVHILSVPKKAWLFRALRLGRRIDEMLVYATAQRSFVVDRLGYPAAQVVLVPFMVDTAFFEPRQEPAESPHVVCSAGLELRDYGTMLRAVDGLQAQVVVAAASPWSKRTSELDRVDLPNNVDVVRLDLHQLRDLYARSSVVVMPLHETDFQAGVTTLLEAMSMGKPVVCTRTQGQTDVIVDGLTGIYVAPGDAAALRAAIESLLADPARRASLGAAARDWVVESADIDVYVRLLAAEVAQLLA